MTEEALPSTSRATRRRGTPTPRTMPSQAVETGRRASRAGEDPAVEFHLNHGDWLRLLRASGFEVTDLIELRPPEGASTRYRFITMDWARRWPAEEVWKARKRG